MRFVSSLPNAVSGFIVRMPGSRTALSSSLSGSTLAENGLTQASTVRVDWNETEEASNKYTDTVC